MSRGTGRGAMHRAMANMPDRVRHRIGLVGITVLLTVAVMSLIGQFCVFVLGG